MKIFKYLFFLLLSCNHSQTNIQNKEFADTTKKEISKDSLLISISKNILQDIKEKDIVKIANNVHNKTGLRLFHYENIDTNTVQKFEKNNFNELYNSDKSFFWGNQEGSGEPINLTLKEYFNKFIYDKDFINADSVSVNKVIGKGNLKNNIKDIYPECDFVEFHFNGFDKKFDGMDWESLILVYKSENNMPLLIAIIHSQWSI